MEEDIHEYHGDDIEVTWDSDRCIHVRECVRGLPVVFDPDGRPWIDPDEGDPDEVAAVVLRCPTGALHFDRDGGGDETVPETDAVTVAADGPLYLRGDVELRTPDGDTILQDTRVALCRCGHSTNKPLCDNSHVRVFEAEGIDPGDVVDVGLRDSDADGGNDGERASDGQLVVTSTRNGPLELDGPFVLRYDVDTAVEEEDAALCRCGGSSSKPYCDGTHEDIGFSTGPDE